MFQASIGAPEASLLTSQLFLSLIQYASNGQTQGIKINLTENQQTQLAQPLFPSGLNSFGLKSSPVKYFQPLKARVTPENLIVDTNGPPEKFPRRVADLGRDLRFELKFDVTCSHPSHLTFLSHCTYTSLLWRGSILVHSLIVLVLSPHFAV
jgi:hypothetical protein